MADGLEQDPCGRKVIGHSAGYLLIGQTGPLLSLSAIFCAAGFLLRTRHAEVRVAFSSTRVGHIGRGRNAKVRNLLRSDTPA